MPIHCQRMAIWSCRLIWLSWMCRRRPAEQQLIEQVLRHKQRLLVLPTSLPWRVMRSLFLAGVDDAADKPYDPDYLIDMVGQMFEQIAARSSYRSIEEGAE